MVQSSKTQKGEDTKARIAQSAAELFDERGYYGTGMNEIISRAGAPKGSVYFHFPDGKEEVATHAMRGVGTEIGNMLKAGLEGSPDPKSAMAAIIGFFKMHLVESEFKCGCPVSTVGMELSGSDSTVLGACAEAYAMWADVLKDYLSQYLPKKKAEELADATFCMVQSDLLVSRVTGDLSHLETAERYCTSLVLQAIPTE